MNWLSVWLAAGLPARTRLPAPTTRPRTRDVMLFRIAIFSRKLDRFSKSASTPRRMDHPPAKSSSRPSLPEAEVARLQATLFSAYETLHFWVVISFRQHLLRSFEALGVLICFIFLTISSWT